ncbi:MAG TPA: peptidoglycan editing factor PgeF [Clostridiales bacterium]|nr:peptidoglycan editing factor PgeF [Clostridiales bacterium]
MFKLKNNSNIKIDFNKEVPYLEFPILKDIPFINHGFSTKLGGVSEGIFSSMNLAFISAGKEDVKESVIKNYELISKSIGIDPHSIVVSKQLHNTNIKKVRLDDMGKGLYRETDYDNIDGLITNIPGISLVTIYADCVPIYLIDIKTKAIGLVHSGWKGTVKYISLVAINKMKQEYGTKPKDIIAVIGPSICRDCYEISEDVAKEFKESFIDNKYNIKTLIKKQNDKYQCDLWLANKYVLLEAGVSPNNIHVSNACTSCNSNVFHSHRKTNGQRGSLAAFLSIKET